MGSDRFDEMIWRERGRRQEGVIAMVISWCPVELLSFPSVNQSISHYLQRRVVEED